MIRRTAPAASIRAAGIAAIAVLVGCDPTERPELTGDMPSCRVAQPAVTLPDLVSEASGVAASQAQPGTLWLHNDSGHDPVLHAVHTSGRALGQVLVTGAENEDWEDIAVAPCPTGQCLYVADIGDNQRSRSQIGLYRVPEPQPGDDATLPAEHFPMRYPSGSRDAEALFVLPSERIFVITKGVQVPIEVFAYPGPLRSDVTVELEPVRRLSGESVPFTDLVTGASANPSGEWVAIRTYTSALLYRTRELLGEGEPTPLNVDLAVLGESQGEAVGLLDNGSVVVASEGGGGGMPGSLAVLWCDLSSWPPGGGTEATADGEPTPQAGS